MNKQPPLGLSFPPGLSDEAAYEIFEFLEALSFAFEEHYFAQSQAPEVPHLPPSQMSEQHWPF
jgi:hypothetical protein